MISTGRHIWGMLGLVGLVLIAALAMGQPAKAAGGAGTSVIGGNDTTVERWPWMAAIAFAEDAYPKKTPRQRQFCGGTIVAPTVVLTASHCAVSMETGSLGDFEVITGRSDLNDRKAGTVSKVKSIRFPVTPNGFPRFLLQVGWDIALLELRSPVPERAVKLAGPDERALLTPGRRLITTGWGFWSRETAKEPERLQMGHTNIQSPQICGSENPGDDFEIHTQVCLGDALGAQTKCYGDSGGPSVVATSEGYRQVGVTSYGGLFCPFTRPSVDAFVGGEDLGTWVRDNVMELSGTDPLGSGGTAGPVSGLCTIPRLSMKRPANVAIVRLKRAGCSKIKIEYRIMRGPKRWSRWDGRLFSRPLPVGWMWKATKPITLKVIDFRVRKPKPEAAGPLVVDP